MAVLNMMWGTMPDVQWKAEEFMAEGDKVMIRFTMSGTQTCPFMGIPATGNLSRWLPWTFISWKMVKLSVNTDCPICLQCCSNWVQFQFLSIQWNDVSGKGIPKEIGMSFPNCVAILMSRVYFSNRKKITNFARQSVHWSYSLLLGKGHFSEDDNKVKVDNNITKEI